MIGTSAITIDLNYWTELASFVTATAALLAVVVSQRTLKAISSQTVPTIEAARREQLLDMSQLALDMSGGDLNALAQIGSFALFDNPGKRIPGIRSSRRTITLIMIAKNEGDPIIGNIVFHYSRVKDLVQDFQKAVGDILTGHELDAGTKAELKAMQQQKLKSHTLLYDATDDYCFFAGIQNHKCMTSSNRRNIIESKT